MSERVLPCGWVQAEVGELCDLINGRAFKPAEWSEEGLPIIRIQNLNNPNASYNHFSGELADKHRIEHGDLLFAWSGTPGTSFGAHVWKGGEAALNQHIFKVGFDGGRIDKRFLRYAINQTLDELIAGAHGGVGLRHVTKGKFEKTRVSLPPLAEQKVLADQLDELLAQVNNLKARLDAIPAILKRFRQSVLVSAYTGRLTESARNEPGEVGQLISEFEVLRKVCWEQEANRFGKKRRYKAPVEGSSISLPEIPEEWRWASVDSLSSKVVDGVHKKPNYTDSGVPFLTVKNLTEGKGISFENVKYVSEVDHREFFKRANPEHGDILITKDGTLGVVRRICAGIEFSIFVSLALVKPVKRSMSRYLELAFQSPVLQAQMAGVGSGLQHIHLTDLRQDMVPIAPENEQKEIVHRVDQLFAFADQIEQQVKNALARVNKLTQSILAKAFRGELTAEWRAANPELISGENSARALLERIKAEKEKLTPKKRRGGRTAMAAT